MVCKLQKIFVVRDDAAGAWCVARFVALGIVALGFGVLGIVLGTEIVFGARPKRFQAEERDL